jgi:cobalt-precorrin 5A hydrolase
MNIAIVTINDPSFEAAKNLLPHLSQHEPTIYNKKQEGEGLATFDKLDDILAIAWKTYDAIIFLLATGAVVRKLAPFLQDKATDPAVILMTLDLKRIIPLLSGHLGGANELSVEIANSIEGCVNFVTTASDQINVLAFDMFAKKEGLEISHLKRLAPVANAIINKELVQVVTYPAMEKKLKAFEGYREGSCRFIYPNTLEGFDEGLPTVYITPQHLHLNELALHISKITLGLGMNRDTTAAEIGQSVLRFCYEHGLEFRQIETLATFEAKADEFGLLEYAQSKNLPLKFFNEAEINSLEEDFSPSMATRFFNIKGVCEPAALLASREKTLFVNKRIYGNVTIAAAF